MNISVESKRAIFLYLVIVLICVLGIQGCTTFNKMVTNNELTMQLATEAATARVLYEHPSWKGATVKITDNAMALIDSSALIELQSVEVYVKSQINWKSMLPEEQALVSTLITQIRLSIEDALRSHEITKPELQMVEVRKVLVWVNETAKRQ